MKRKERIEKVKKALLAMQRYSWEQGVAAQALLESGEPAWAILFAKDAVVRQTADGRLGVMGDNLAVTDPAANGEAVLYAAKITGDPQLAQAAEKMAAWLLHNAPKTADGTLYHHTHTRQVWVDSFYMAPPFLAAAGHYQEAIEQIDGFRKLLWQPAHKLYAHIWDDDLKAFARKDFWGVGNGWAAAGMTRILRALPDTMRAEKNRLAGYVKEVIDGCLQFQRADGLFHDVVDQPTTFVETNLAQMLSYAIYRGITGGWLDHGYLKPADEMRQAVYAKVDEFGLVQGVCGAPHFNRPGTAPEGQAFFLLMEAAAKDLRKTSEVLKTSEVS